MVAPTSPATSSATPTKKPKKFDTFTMHEQFLLANTPHQLRSVARGAGGSSEGGHTQSSQGKGVVRTDRNGRVCLAFERVSSPT